MTSPSRDGPDKQFPERFRLGFEIQANWLASLTHDLNTPIATLLLEAQTLDTPNIDPRRQAFVRSVSEEMRTLASVIEDAFTIFDAIDRAVRRDLEPCAIHDILEASIEDSEAAAATDCKESIRLMTPNKSSDASTLRVCANTELLRLLLDTILRHSIGRSPDNTAVTLEWITRRNLYELRVRDLGAPLPASRIGRIATSAVEGTEDRAVRVRFAVCAGIAELFGGVLQTQNVPEGGVEHLLVLPLHENKPPTQDAP